MKRDFRLHDVEMLDEKHFPVQVVFNSVNDSRFIEVV